MLNSRVSTRPFIWSALLALLVMLLVGVGFRPKTSIAAPNAWGPLRIEFNEAAFPGSSTNLVNAGAPGPVVFEYDVLTQEVTSTCGGTDRNYTLGADGTADLRLTATLVTQAGLSWEKTEGDYSTVTSGSFRSDWRTAINSGTSRPNDYAYVKFDFEFINGLELSNTGSQFATRHTSTNGKTELYEWTQVTVNGTAINEGNIGLYQNTDYSDTSGASNSGLPFPPGITMSEFLTGSSSGTHAPGGLIMPGWWAIDDFNTTILDGPEAPTTNPGTGNGSVDDDQTVTGTDFGLANNTLVQQITYYFGVTDVAFDTDGDSFTETNSSPAAGVTWFELGIADTDCPVPVELADFAVAEQPDGTALVTWETASEIDHAGFNVYRSGSKAFDPTNATQLNAELIAAQGSFGQGASYSLADEAVRAGVWYYFLEDIDIYGANSLHGPVVVDLTQPTSTALTGMQGDSTAPHLLLLLATVTLGLIGIAALQRSR